MYSYVVPLEMSLETKGETDSNTNYEIQSNFSRPK
jgi:hypothetical protein